MTAPVERIGPHFLRYPKTVPVHQASRDSSSRGLTAAELWLSTIAIIAAAFCVGFTYGICLPLTSLVFEKWGEPAWMIGLGGAVPSIAVLMALPFSPAIAVKLGAVRSVVYGSLLGCIGFLALYLFQSTYAWLVIRFLMSAALALPWLVGETWINTVSESSNRGRVVAIYAAAFFAGFAAGPAALDFTGIDGFLPIGLGIGGLIACCIPVLLAARVAPEFPPPEEASGLVSSFWLAPVAMAAALVGGIVEMVYYSLLPNVALAAGMTDSAALRLLVLLTAGGGVLQFFIGWLADRTSRMKVLVLNGLLFILLSLALPLSLHEGVAASVLAFLIGGTLLGFYTLALSIIGDDIQPGDLAGVNATFLIMYNVGGIIGPLIAGGAMTVAPVGGFVAAVSGSVIVSGLLIWLAASRHRANA